MMKNIVSRDIALKLKEKLFNLECLYHYTTNGALRPNYVHPVDGEYTLEGAWGCCNTLFSDNTCDAPEAYQVLEWLRKERNFHIVCPYYESEGFYFYVQEFGIGGRYNSIDKDIDFYQKYEQAELAGIKYVIDNLI